MQEKGRNEKIWTIVKNHTTFTPVVKSVDEVFTPQTNTLVKLLAKRLGE